MAAGFLPLGAQAALVEDASPYLTQQMLLGDDLTFQLQGNVNYYYAEHAVATLAYADRVDTYRLEDLTPTGDGLCAIAAELAAAQMTEDIVLTIRVGEVVVLQETYSIRNYLSLLLDGSFGNQTKQLCRELLNYGAWAQKYFEHRQDDLANSGYEIEPQYSIAKEMPAVEISGGVSGIEFYGTSVRFTSKTAVRYYFTGSAANCTFAVDGVEYTPVSKDGMYYIEVPGVNPQDMETPMQVEVTDGTDTLSVRYVPLNYFVRSYQKATDDTYRGLLQAAYSYFKTAASYTPEENEDLGQSGGAVELPEVVPDSENLILGFDSYEEITGTKIAVSNEIGRMEINTDPSYITQGKASLKVCPQGYYSVSGKDPYFKIDLLDTTCATDDFSQFKRVTFDVYNPQNETLHIRAGLVLGSDPNSYLTTIKQTIALNPNGWTTCSYDLSIMAGCGFYDLANVRYMTFAFAEHKTSKEDTPNVLYIDNLKGVPYGENEGVSPIDFGFETGLDFETYGHEYLFTGQGKANDAVVDRVRYYSVGSVSAPANGGSYGLRLSHGSDYYPTFRIHFGKTLPADTQITFQAYGRITSGTNLYNQSIFEFTGGGEATKQFACDQWTQLTITLSEAAEYVDLFWNYERAGITSTTASGEVYIDNIRAITPQPSGDFAQGIDFESIGHAERFAGQDNAVTQRILYTNTAVSAPTDGGLYALKASGEVNKQIPFRINFGRQLAAGTVVSFEAFGNITVTSGWALSKNCEFLFASGSSAISSFNTNTWKSVSFTLSEAAEYIDLIWQYSVNGFGVKATGEVFMDNFKAVEPVVISGDVLEGLDFEDAGNALWFNGIGDAQATIGRVSYANAGVTAVTNGGEYALKLSHASSCWPNFRVNFGKTLASGTTITFDVYGNYDYEAAEGVYKYMKLELTADSKNFATSADSNQVVWTLVETWQTGVTVTLTADSDHVDFFYNVADGQHGEVSSWILLDNFKAVESTIEEGDFLAGFGFENIGHEQRFEPLGGEYAGRDATLERVTYADSGITAPANGGEYALKITCESSQWPVFRINFGTTLKAGTIITFQAYTNDTSGIRNTVSSFQYLSDDSDVAPEYFHGSWNTQTFDLQSDCSYIDLMCNMDRWYESGPANLEVYLDNFKATEPSEVSGVITDGLDFETEADAAFFAGQGMNQDATIERVTYADLGVSAPTDGGEYALKLSHASNYWPTFRIQFGKTLKAGTTITFWAYGKITSGTNLYNQSIFEFSSGSPGGSGDATAEFKCDQWVQLTITLSADAEYIDLFWNYDRASITSSTASGEVYIDVITVTEP